MPGTPRNPWQPPQPSEAEFLATAPKRELEASAPPARSGEVAPPGDAELVAQVIGGSRERFELLVERHGRALLGYLRRRARDGEEARELFQETWVQAYEGLAGLRDPTRLRAWLITIAHNTLRKGLRRARALPLEDRDSPRAPEIARDALEGAELREELRRAVASLPARQREVFELRAVQELSHAEIAERLGIREENARANFYQALRRLRTALGGER